MNALLQHIPPVLRRRLKRVGSTGGGEYKGPCPWCGGEDRFTVSPARGESGLWCCRQCERGGDGIDLLCSDAGGGLSFEQACRALRLTRKLNVEANGTQRRARGSKRPAEKPTRTPKPPKAKPALLRPPGVPWQDKARAFVEESRRALWKDTAAAASARAYLAGRGLTEETIRAAGLGVNAQSRRPLRTSWGLLPRERKREKECSQGGRIWLPRGIVIPWEIGPALWKVNIRRPSGDLRSGGGPKYAQVAGVRPSTSDAPAWSTNALYGADALTPGAPAVLVEGELDALAVRQAAGDLAVSVATGSTYGARKPRWIGRLSGCRPVLLAFDAEEPGEKAARYWRGVLPDEALPLRWRPYWQDAAAMLEAGADVCAWIESGLRRAEGASAPA